MKDPGTFYSKQHSFRERGNYDLFGSDNAQELHFGKFYLHLFDGLFSVYHVTTRINYRNFAKELVKQYQVPRQDIYFHLRFSRMGKSKKEDYAWCYLVLKPYFCVALDYNLIYFQFGSEVPFSEIKKVLNLSRRFQENREDPNKFYMIENQFYEFKLSDFKLKPCSINVAEKIGRAHV